MIVTGEEFLSHACAAYAAKVGAVGIPCLQTSLASSPATGFPNIVTNSEN